MLMSGRLRAEPGWRWARSGQASRFLFSSVCFSSLGPPSSLLSVLVGVGVGVGWNIIQHIAIGVFGPIGADGSRLHLADSRCQNTLTMGGSIITRK